jgi:hypothetical protein
MLIAHGHRMQEWHRRRNKRRRHGISLVRFLQPGVIHFLGILGLEVLRRRAIIRQPHGSTYDGRRPTHRDHRKRQQQQQLDDSFYG